MITHVAIKNGGITYSLPAPNRHHHVIRQICQKTGQPLRNDDEQGFLDENGQFYDREQALRHALMHKQVLDEENIRAGMLFSEDLW